MSHASTGRYTFGLVGQLRGACTLLCRADMGVVGYLIVMFILSGGRQLQRGQPGA